MPCQQGIIDLVWTRWGSYVYYFIHWIPIPEEAGIDSKETEAANKEVEKLQTVTQNRKQYSTSSNNKLHIVDIALKSQLICCILEIFLLIYGILEKN